MSESSEQHVPPRGKGRVGRSPLLAMALLSAAVLLVQVALTRIFSVAQTYHFAFLVISLALLGFGASGSFLALWPRLRSRRLWPWYALGCGVTTVLGYLLVNLAPFDAYRIAWDPTHVYLLVLNLLALAVPFAFAGSLIGAMLAERADDAGRVYASNLAGSGVGALLAPLAIGVLGAERSVVLCGVLGAGAALALAGTRSRARAVALVGALAGAALLVALPPSFEAQASPYKRLSQVRLDPDARILATRQDARARLDIITAPTLHSAPGLSLAYAGAPPPQAGLLLDGDALLPVPDASRMSPELSRSLPLSVAHSIRPSADVLLLGSGGGLEPWAALGNGARRVTVVEPNQLVLQALQGDLRGWAGLADHPAVTLHQDEIRTFTSTAGTTHDIVELTLTDNYRPISSGAFTLTESYTLTTEAFRSYLRLCGEDGLFVITRWAQAPPSEALRTLALIVEALDGRDPRDHVVAFRTFQTVTFVVKPTPFDAAETDRLLADIDRLRYDLVLAPRIPPEAVNRYARVDRPLDHELALRLATTPDRAAFYSAYPFDVSPPTDDRPFFFGFFRWQQTEEVLEGLGRRWQPFGGSGPFLLVALLGFAAVAALSFVVAPIALRRRFRAVLTHRGRGAAVRALVYFAAIGLAFLFVEIASIQRFILVLGHPTYALAVVVGSLLVFSGLGASLSARVPWRAALIALAAVAAVHPLVTSVLAPSLLGLPSPLRAAAVIAAIAPLGLLMGIPFARGIAALGGDRELIPWAWAANGSASVVSGALASMLAVSTGFTPVLVAGAALYLIAALVAVRPAATVPAA